MSEPEIGRLIDVVTWSQYHVESPAAVNTSRFGHTAVTVSGAAGDAATQLVVYGGVSVGGDQPQEASGEQYAALGSLAVLDLADSVWRAAQPQNSGPGRRAFHCAAARGSTVWIFGGHVLSFEVEHNRKKRHFFADLWALDTVTWTWTRLDTSAAVSPARRDMSALVHTGHDSLLLFGGRSETGKALNDLWLFDLNRSAWFEVHPSPGPCPVARKMHAMVVCSGMLILLGGERDSGPLDDLWTLRGLDAAEPYRWTQLKVRPAPSGRFGHHMAVCGTDTVAVFGGCRHSGSFLSLARNYTQSNELWLLHTTSFSWTNPPPPGGGEWPSARMCHSLSSTPDGRLLLQGGRNKDSICDDVWCLSHCRVQATEDDSAAAAAAAAAAGVLSTDATASVTAADVEAHIKASAPSTPTSSTSRKSLLSNIGNSQQSLLQSLLQPLQARGAAKTISTTSETPSMTNLSEPGSPQLTPRLSMKDLRSATATPMAAAATAPLPTSTPANGAAQDQPASSSAPTEQHSPQQLMSLSEQPQQPSGQVAAEAASLAVHPPDTAPAAAAHAGSSDWRTMLTPSGAINRLSNTVTSSVSTLLAKVEDAQSLQQRLQAIRALAGRGLGRDALPAGDHGSPAGPALPSPAAGDAVARANSEPVQHEQGTTSSAARTPGASHKVANLSGVEHAAAVATAAAQPANGRHCSQQASMPPAPSSTPTLSSILALPCDQLQLGHAKVLLEGYQREATRRNAEWLSSELRSGSLLSTTYAQGQNDVARKLAASMPTHNFLHISSAADLRLSDLQNLLAACKHLLETCRLG